MAQKQISRARKKKLKEPDEFISFSSKILNFVIENKNRSIAFFSAFLFIILMIAGLKIYSIKSENRAFSDMAQAMAEYQTAAIASQINSRDESKVQKIDAVFNRILDKYLVMNAKKFAKVFLANISLQNKQLDRAIELYTEAVNDFADAPAIKNLILNSLAYALEEKNDFKSAAAYLEMIVSGQENFIKDEALFNLGRLYAATGDQTKSREAFVKITKNHPDSLFIELAKEKI